MRISDSLARELKDRVRTALQAVVDERLKPYEEEAAKVAQTYRSAILPVVSRFEYIYTGWRSDEAERRTYDASFVCEDQVILPSCNTSLSVLKSQMCVKVNNFADDYILGLRLGGGVFDENAIIAKFKESLDK